MAIVRGVWTCTDCLGGVDIPGNLKVCPACGKPRNQNLTPEEGMRFPDNTQIVTDPAEIAAARAGPDWNCGHCETLNPAAATVCTYCGRLRNHDDTVNRVVHHHSGIAADGVVMDSPDALRLERAAALVDEVDDAKRVLTGQPERFRDAHLPDDAVLPQDEIADRLEGYRRSRSIRSSVSTGAFLDRHMLKVVVVAGAAALCGLILWVYSAFFATEPVQLTVQGLSWERQIEIEALRTFEESGWSIPPSGRYIRDYPAVHHYEDEFSHYESVPRQVQTGTTIVSVQCGDTKTDLGNGYFDVQPKMCSQSEAVYGTIYEDQPVYVDKPVYWTKYDYEIDRWVTDSWVEASGTQSAPHWPEPPALSRDQRVGDERRERYSVALVTETQLSYQADAPYSVWDGLEPGQSVTGHINKRGDLRRVDWPD